MAMSRLPLVAIVLLCAVCANGQWWPVVSPDGTLVVTAGLVEGRLSYRAELDKRPLLYESALGLEGWPGPWRVESTAEQSQDSVWRPVYGERSLIRDHYRELTVRLRHAEDPARGLALVVRVYDGGFAFRYALEGQGEFRLTKELTEFRFPVGAHGYEEYGTEGEYSFVPVTAIKDKCERPLTVDLRDGRFAAVHEAALVDYPRMLLGPGEEGALQARLGSDVRGRLPFTTPWRVVLTGRRPADLLLHNDLILNLNPPQAIADTSFIQPGKAIREVTLSTRGGRAAADFAVRHGLQFVEYDAGWYGHEYDDTSDATTVSPDPKRIANIPDHGGLDLEEVIRYAKERGIGVLLYVNRRALERQLDTLLPLYAKWGVKGVKFGFVQVGPQEWAAWLHEAIRKAAAHRLMVDVHDAYRPTGFARTYPNLMTQEGVRGNEHMPTARHNTTLPFTRFLAGPADYTVCYYTPRLKTTRAHQLALPVVYFSPWQFLFWYDKPSDSGDEPELEFFRAVPATWDETRVLDDRIGEHVTIARRRGEEWFVGTITNETPRTAELPLTFLDPNRKYEASTYCDGETPKQVLIERLTVTGKDRLSRQLAASGGCAVWLRPR